MPHSPSAIFYTARPAAALKALLRVGILSLLSACATHSTSPQLVDESQEAARYAAHAAGDYTPPGPPDDPWGPFITQASQRFDVPDRWIREVMRVESGGNEYINGELTTSPVGAMGLMQVMPETYDELKLRYGLGEDAYDPQNNILAGSAYIREMYDLYGAPAFLAAYNAGPGRVDDYMLHHRPLPQETRRYLAMIAPYIQETWPLSRSAADEFAMNLPGGFDYVPVPHYPHNPRGYAAPAVVMAEHRIGIHPYVAHAAREPFYARAQPGSWRHAMHARVMYAMHAHATYAMRARPMYASLRRPSRASHAWSPPGYPNTVRVRNAMATSHGGGGFRLVSQAMAESLAFGRSGGSSAHWGVQVGAFGSHDSARAAAEAVRGTAHGALGKARSVVGTVHEPRATLYRARLTGLSHGAAVQACERLIHGHSRCMVLSPATQS